MQLKAHKEAVARALKECVICGKEALNRKDKDNLPLNRCKKHQRDLDKVWYVSYTEYLGLFKGQH